MAVEAEKLRQEGVGDPGAEPSAWLAILDAVRRATVAERGRDVSYDVSIVETALSLEDPAARRECLRLQTEALGRQPGRLRVFRATADRICDNLLDPAAEARPPPELVAKLEGLRADLEALGVGDEGESKAGWLAEGRAPERLG